MSNTLLFVYNSFHPMLPLTFDEFSAQASILGYLYQIQYALWLALRETRSNPADVHFALERTDDVQLLTGTQTTQITQVKRHSKPGTLTDKSDDLWKTLRVWSQAIIDRKVDPSRTRFFLVTTHLAAPDSAPSLLRPRGIRDEKRAQSLLLDAAATSKSASLKDAFAAFHALPQTTQLDFLRNVRVLDQHQDLGDLREQIKSELRYAVNRPYLDAALRGVGGWWFEEVMRHLQAPGTDTISGEEVYTQVLEWGRKLNDSNLPTYTLDNIPVDVYLNASEDHLFLRHLRIIKAEDRDIHLAIEFFYKATETRNRWLKDYLVTSEEIEKYADELEYEWRILFNRLCRASIIKGMDDDQKANLGQDVLFEIYGTGHQIRHDVRDKSIIRGSFHILSDNGRIGWHPEHNLLIKKV